MKLCVNLLLLVFVLIKSESTDLRILGGLPAEQNEFPYQVSVEYLNITGYYYQQFCAGSILNKRWILTAAHCINNQLNIRARIVAGGLDLGDESSFKQMRDVIEMFYHENYAQNGYPAPNDIGLMKVNKSFKFNLSVKPISLPEPGRIPFGSAIISGWGSTSYTDEPNYSSILLKVTVPIINYKKCVQLHDVPYLRESNICAGNGKKSTCNGDSGGALIQKTSNGIIQIGIMSWVPLPCGDQNKPAVYTRVSYFIDWINNNID